MNKNLLTVLGCSGSLSLMLFAVNPANASTPISLNFNPNLSIERNGEISATPDINQDQTQSSLPEINADQIGNLALITSGCNCPSCRAQVPQTVEL